MGGKKHLTRYVAPRFWPIAVKERHWAVKPSPGPHPINRCFPLLVVVRDMLKYAKTAQEARKIIAEGKVKVDGRVRRNYKFPIGLMDVVEIVETGECFRVLPYPTRFMILHPIPREESSFKLCRIEKKTMVKGGNIQLNLHDSRNIIVELEDPFNPVEDVYKSFDVVKIAVPNQEILDHLRLEKGNIAIVIGGRNVGRVGRIVEVKQVFKRASSIVSLVDKDENVFHTSLNYIFVIGRDKPAISLPEGAWK